MLPLLERARPTTGTGQSSKEGHSPLFQTGIFGSRVGKSNRQGQKPMKFKANEIKKIKIQNFIRRFQFGTSMRGYRHIKESAYIGTWLRR
ncbi:hypothetical protein AVEN_146184-1 [Araneus ventricosus]|uniref:Uncharacterized protein n=1 Tax=Araneus ventricosus TaxID=182803 RepID=A0A4Y2CK34_ARAVE|nr:hypothetical protein AVEN_146184-1 [Araneus ventricosus]